MAEKLTFILLIVLSSSLYSQNEYFENDPRWQTAYSCYWGAWPMDYHNIYDHISGETEIDGYTYKILHTTPNTQMTALREFVRSEGKKIYAIDPETNTEELMYDFDAEIGDTLEVSEDMYTGVLVVESISTVIVNGEERKVFTVVDSESGNYPAAPVLIEGVGNSINGLFGYIFGWFDCGITPMCYSIHNMTYTWENAVGYTLENFTATEGVCALADKVDDIRKVRLQIFPNPVGDYITIQNLSSSKTDYRILNSLGEIVLDGITQTNTIELQNLAVGYYILLIGSNEHSTTLSFVK